MPGADPGAGTGRSASPRRGFTALVDGIAARLGVGAPGELGPGGLGFPALEINGAIFVVLVHGQLVAKLSAPRSPPSSGGQYR